MIMVVNGKCQELHMKVCQLCRIANDFLFDASLCGVLLYKEHMFELGAQTDVAARTPTFTR